MIDLNLKPSGKELKQFALIQLIFCLILSGWLYYKYSYQTGPTIISLISAIIFLAGMVQPKLIKGLFVFLIVVTFPIGWVVSQLILVFVFYLVMTPVGLIMKLIGYDPLHRKLDLDESSYWVKRDENKTGESYFKQY